MPGNLSVPAEKTAAYHDPNSTAWEVGQANREQINSMNSKLGGIGGSKKSLKGGSPSCPSWPDSSTWPTFPGQSGPFSTTMNANTASKIGNAVHALQQSQAVYDSNAGDIPTGLQGALQSGGRRRLGSRRGSRLGSRLGSRRGSRRGSRLGSRRGSRRGSRHGKAYRKNTRAPVRSRHARRHRVWA